MILFDYSEKEMLKIFQKDYPVSDLHRQGNINHFQLMFHFYIPWKHSKTGGFLVFWGGLEVKNCLDENGVSYL